MIRFSDTDVMKHINNATYIEIMETQGGKPIQKLASPRRCGDECA